MSKFKTTSWSNLKCPTDSEDRFSILTYTTNAAESVNSIIKRDLPRTKSGSFARICESIHTFMQKQARRLIQLNQPGPSKIHLYYKSLWTAILS